MEQVNPTAEGCRRYHCRCYTYSHCPFVMSVVELKTYNCRKCGTELSDENCYGNWRKNRDYICKSCNKKEWRKHKYGLSHEDYEAKLAEQNFSCASCGTHLSDFKDGEVLNVDHNHDTGEVRDLLCTGCNRAFGFLVESVDKIEGLLRYAKKWSNG